MIDQSIIDKINKLINLRESAESIGSLHEAENAAARLQEMLMKHNLDEEEVRAKSISKKAEIEDGWFDLPAGKSESFWVPKLYGAIARNNMCICGVGKNGIRIIGHKDQVALVCYIADQMVAKVRMAEKMSWSNYTGMEKRGTYRRGFFDGATVGINNRLAEEVQKMQQEANPYAVMIINKKKEVQEFVDVLRSTGAVRYGAVKMGSKLSSQSGYVNGYEAGKKMNINQGLGQSQPKGRLE